MSSVVLFWKSLIILCVWSFFEFLCWVLEIEFWYYFFLVVGDGFFGEYGEFVGFEI